MARPKLATEIVARRAAVGAALRVARKEKEWSSAQLADALGISAPYLANIEAGRRPLTPELMIKVTEVLGVEVAA